MRALLEKKVPLFVRIKEQTFEYLTLRSNQLSLSKAQYLDTIFDSLAKYSPDGAETRDEIQGEDKAVS